jgi:hypothetical protein
MLEVEFNERTGAYKIKRDEVVIAEGAINPRTKRDPMYQLLQALAKAKKVPESQNPKSIPRP